MNFLSGIFGSKNSPEMMNKKEFEEAKNVLAKLIHKQALEWFDEATTSYAMEEAFTQKDGCIPCLKVNLKTKEEKILYVDGKAIMQNVPSNYQELIDGLSKEERIVYNFFHNKQIKEYNSAVMNVPANVIKSIENIKDIKDSAILKVATLQFLQDTVCDQNYNYERMLDKKYSSWWK